MSLAAAVTFTIPLTCALFAGALIETDGGVPSDAPVSALNATSCMTHAVPFCEAVAL